MPIDWGSVTVEDIEQEAPQLLAAIRAKVTTPPTDTLTAEQVKKLVSEEVAAATKSVRDEFEKRETTGRQVREFISKAGLPQRTQNRLISAFAEMGDFDEKAVKEAVDDAKAELREAGAGPRITGMGPTGQSAPEGPKMLSVRESVENVFKKTSAKPATPKES